MDRHQTDSRMRRRRWLRRGAMAAPIVAQSLMAVMLLVQRQWLFAMMVGAGILAMAAAFLPAANTPEDGGSGPAIAGPDATDPAAASRTVFPTGTLESLLGLDGDAAPFRTLVHRWARAVDGCRATVGFAPDGSPVAIDLVGHGPHAMVAGTTGAGKSVLLQDWCLALACSYGPQRLQFVLLDFKGGSTMDTLSALPHVRGCVNDLDLAYAVRALLALERELTRRERLASRLASPDLMAHPQAPARLLIIVDEFHMLHGQLPDYMDRLVRIASLGRSLGMHLVACTQNPLGQLSDSMKANINCRICLRVRDELQSREMTGGRDAAHLDPAMPGLAIMSHGDLPVRFRCARPGNVDALVRHVDACARFHGMRREPMLFTPPLPAKVSMDALGSLPAVPGAFPLGLADNGVAYEGAWYDPAWGNLAVVGQADRGTGTLLANIRRYAADHGLAVRCVPDADGLLDPLNMEAEAEAFRRELADPGTCTVFSLASGRHLRIPEHCRARFVMPTGERTVDLADGIPAALLASLGADDYRTAGRGVLLHGAVALLIQCVND